jgi:hypothetical protein
MILAMIASVLVGGLLHGNNSYEDCKKIDFKNKACVTSETMHDLGKLMEKAK